MSRRSILTHGSSADETDVLPSLTSLAMNFREQEALDGLP
jgi:hypothetical protein